MQLVRNLRQNNMAAVWTLLVALMCYIMSALTATIDSGANSVTTTYMDILMKGAKPLQPDAYLCTSYEVEEDEAYVVKFEALADADTAHHILIYGCSDEGFSNRNIWACPPICRSGRQQIIFAWAKNAKPTQLPDGVGFRIGKKTSIKTIVMQIHYAKAFDVNDAADKSGIRLHLSLEKQPYVAGIFLMLSFSFSVPPNEEKYHVDMSCQYNEWHKMYPFAYRTHAHGLGRVIAGYQYNQTGFHMIGKGNPQWPQAFYPSNASIEVNRGDKLVARCTYNSTGMDHTVDVGATGNDEMCNFYIMFYTSSSVKNPYGECGGNQIPRVVDKMPADSDVTLPPNPLLDEVAHGHHHHHHHGMAQSSNSVDQHSEPTVATGKLNIEDTQSAVSADQRWFDLSDTNSSHRDRQLIEYLAQNIYNKRQQAEESVPKSEEELPNYFEKWQDGFGDIEINKRLGGEYYEDYAANDEREQGTFPDTNPGLSRNRNRAFEAMNQELKGFQHIKPHGEAAESRYWQYPQTNSRKKLGSMPVVPTMPPLGNDMPAEPLLGHLVYQSDWPSQELKIGQVGGLATDKKGNVYIFHRGSRTWDRDSFDSNDNFQYQNNPIMEDTVIIFSREGKFIRQFGSGKFFMPHGITVDDKNNIWLTDVALHQVFRIPPGGTEPDLTLGERFVNSDDTAHFCKPSDVAVLSSGEFFVSDGYCHSRVLKFSKEGNVLKQWGRPSAYNAGREPQPGSFIIPHSVTVAEDLDLVCVADRENGRIQCFDLQGNFRFIFKHPEFGPRLFAVEYCPRHGGLLFAVNGPTFDGSIITVKGFTISLHNSSLAETWNLPVSEGLQNPHDVAVDVEGHAVYVGELNPKAVWKFQRQTGQTATTFTPTTTSHPAAAQHVTQTADKKDNIEPSGKANMNVSTAKDASRKDTLSSEVSKESMKEKEESDFTPSIIIGVLLVIPVVLLLVITLVMRLHHKGWDSCFSRMRTPKVFNLQSFLGNSHRGFDKLSQEDSDHDADVLSDSDNEEFRQPIKSKA